MSAKIRKPGSVRVRTQLVNKKKESKIALAAAIGAMGMQLFPLLGVGARHAEAATYNWDPGLTPTTPSGGTGTWNLSTADWSNGATDGLWTDTSSTGTDTAVFDGTGGGLVTLNSNLSALGIFIDNTAYKISGTSTLTLGSGGINTSVLSSGTTTIAAAIALAANQFWNIGTGSTVLDTSVISGTNFGITEIGGGTIKLNAATTYTGTTNLEDGTLNLNFTAAAAPTSNILASTSTLDLGGGTLQLAASTTATNTQTFAGTTLTSGASAIAITNTGSKVPVLALGPITISGASAQGQALVLTGLTSVTGATSAVGELTIGKINGTTLGANGILIPGTANASNYGIAGACFATVGSYDYAAIDPTGTFVEGGSAITGFYSPFSSSNSTLAGNADISGTITNDTGGDTITSVRFNSTSATTLTLRSLAHTGGILVTPNLGANNVTITGPADDLTARDNGTLATEMIVYQNNTLGFLNLNTGIGATTVSGGAYTQVGAGTVTLGTASNLSTYTGQSYLEGGVTEIAADGDIGAAATGATLNLLGGTLMASATFTLDNGGGANPRPINIATQGGTLAAAGTNTLTVDGAITGTGALQIGTGTIAGSGSGTANTTAVKGNNGTVILSGGATQYLQRRHDHRPWNSARRWCDLQHRVGERHHRQRWLSHRQRNDRHFRSQQKRRSHRSR